jgi:hypothetical protein
MSRNINVNPAHYKLAGRERQGENVVQSVERQAYAQQKAEADRWRAKEAPPPWETTPPAAPVTQEQRDEATAIAQVQRKKVRAAPKRTARRNQTSKRGAPRRATSKRTASTRAASPRPAARRRPAAKPAKRGRATKPVRRRAR